MWTFLDFFRRKAAPADPLPSASTPASALAGKPLRYLIGARKIDWESFDAMGVIEVGYDIDVVPPALRDRVIGYGNFWDEEQTGRFGPYLKPTDTARHYDEGVIDPKGPGWKKNLVAQFERRARQGIGIIELDNPDPYPTPPVLQGYDLALEHGLSVIGALRDRQEPVHLRGRRRLDGAPRRGRRHHGDGQRRHAGGFAPHADRGRTAGPAHLVCRLRPRKRAGAHAADREGGRRLQGHRRDVLRGLRP